MKYWKETEAPLSKAGDYVDFVAEMDLIVAITACSAPRSNDGVMKPIRYRVFESWVERRERRDRSVVRAEMSVWGVISLAFLWFWCTKAADTTAQVDMVQ